MEVKFHGGPLDGNMEEMRDTPETLQRELVLDGKRTVLTYKRFGSYGMDYQFESMNVKA